MTRQHDNESAFCSTCQSELGPLDDFVETDFVGDIDMSELSEEIDDLLEDMPPSPLVWDDRDHQDSVDSFYLNNVSGYRLDIGLHRCRVLGFR